MTVADQEPRFRPNDEPHRVHLPANSFELSELDTALDKAIGVKDEAKHGERIDAAIREHAKMPEVLEARDRGAIPEGTELQEVTNQAGQKAEMPVSKPADGAKSGEEASRMELDSTREALAGAETGATTDTSAAAADATGEGTGGSRRSSRGND